MAEIYEPTEHSIRVGVGIIKQVVKNRVHPLDIIREAISNSCAKQVKATKCNITIFYDGTYGWSFIFEDDGIGMNYTGLGEDEHQGRLDRFLNLAYGGIVGLDSDEFGHKGLGSKLMYYSRRLEIDTKIDNGESCKVIVDNPAEKLIEMKKPELPKPIIYRKAPESFEHGTIIRVYGYDGGKKHPEYDNPDKLKRYLYFRTLIGYTRLPRIQEGFPIITIRTPSITDGERIELGFPWITKEGTHLDDQKIGVIDPNIVVTKTDKQGNKTTVTLKGGYALKTSEFDMVDYGLLESKGVGLTYVWKGIPYFNLDFNHYKPQGFQLYYKFCRFVVECDDIDTDMARSRISDSTKEHLFTSALREAFRRIEDTANYQEWVKFRRDQKRKLLGESLNKRKAKLIKPNQKWVYYKNDLLHKEPTCENDVLALLWKLEALRAIPFYHFRTLEHTALEGIDVIADYQEKNYSEMKIFQAVEVEYILENYDNHDHSPEQTSLIIAWDSKNKNNLTQREDSWQFVWDYMGQNLNVVLLRYLPDLVVKEKDT
ncbi:unnamed protein product [marine sediment metagenome]|uniref:Histidine kinase/HSP90-like ATPase domain-containing protein n=1 Tax=marine sediment metagenome TaxID=412755 RepID=X1JV64_9ZZZZ